MTTLIIYNHALIVLEGIPSTTSYIVETLVAALLALIFSLRCLSITFPFLEDILLCRNWKSTTYTIFTRGVSNSNIFEKIPTVGCCNLSKAVLSHGFDGS